MDFQSNFVSDYRVQRRQITDVVFYTKLLVNDILVGLERILDYVRFDCTYYPGEDHPCIHNLPGRHYNPTGQNICPKCFLSGFSPIMLFSVPVMLLILLTIILEHFNQ